MFTFFFLFFCISQRTEVLKLNHLGWSYTEFKLKAPILTIGSTHHKSSASAGLSSPSVRSLPFIFGLSFLKPEVKDHFLHFSFHKLQTWAEDISALKFRVIWESTYNKLYNKKCFFMSLKVFTCLWYKWWIVVSLGHILQYK